MRFRKMICFLLAVAFVVTVLPTSTTASSITLRPGSHARWIDRIGDLPKFASDFYTWLENNANANGALVDPSKATLVDGEYVYQLDTVKGTLQLATNLSGQDVQNAVVDAINEPGERIMEVAMEVYAAFDRDHPEVFWLSGHCQTGMNLNYSYNQSTGKVSYELTVDMYLKNADFDIRLAEFQSASAIRDAIAQRDACIANILAGCPKDASFAEFVRYFNQVLTCNNGYNSAIGKGEGAPDIAWECISALAGSYGTSGPVCEGYARAFKVLCDRVGIPCILTEGYAKTSHVQPQLHMWNYVQVDGSWYAVDVTWNDPIVSGKEHVVETGYESDTYLLIGANTRVWGARTFSQTHQVSNCITSSGVAYTNGPQLAANAYQFTVTEPDPKPTPDPEPDQTGSPCVSEYLSVDPYRGQTYSAPIKAGYVFAGWFSDEQLTAPLEPTVTQGKAYAAFVDEKVLTVKCQLSEGVSNASESGDLRLLTGVADIQLAAIFFQVNGDRAFLPTGLYEKLEYGNTTAQDLFGVGAAYIGSFIVENISGERFDDLITVIPGWYTLDGTLVMGVARTLRFSDGLS